MNLLTTKRIISGLISFIINPNPRLKSETFDAKKKARYYYSVYLRHLILYNKIRKDKLISIVEIGPGKILGCGSLAILLGTERYVGVDIFKNYDIDKTIAVFNELVTLLSNKESVPYLEFPHIKPYLSNYEFPTYIISDNDLKLLLKPERIDKIRKSISNPTISECIKYINFRNIEFNTLGNIDFIFSQAVLEYIKDLNSTVKLFYSILNPMGIISHQIDLGSHSIVKGWNAHYRYSRFLWWVIKGNYKSFIQRRPYSFYIDVFKINGFKISNEITITRESAIKISELSKSFNRFNNDDLNISSLFIQATK